MFSLVIESRDLYLFEFLVFYRREKIKNQLALSGHQMVLFWLGKTGFSSCFCKVFFVSSGFQACGPWIFTDHFLSLMLDFCKFFTENCSNKDFHGFFWIVHWHKQQLIIHFVHCSFSRILFNFQKDTWVLNINYNKKNFMKVSRKLQR
jgi:hypothetical protein